MRKRTEVIREWIDARMERGETTKCMFYITVPKDIPTSYNVHNLDHITLSHL